MKNNKLDKFQFGLREVRIANEGIFEVVFYIMIIMTFFKEVF